MQTTRLAPCTRRRIERADRATAGEWRVQEARVHLFGASLSTDTDFLRTVPLGGFTHKSALCCSFDVFAPQVRKSILIFSRSLGFQSLSPLLATSHVLLATRMIRMMEFVSRLNMCCLPSTAHVPLHRSLVRAYACRMQEVPPFLEWLFTRKKLSSSQ
jgi:hypothetical protein